MKVWTMLLVVLSIGLGGGLLGGCAGVVIGGAAATASVANDRRTTGTMVEDQSIEFKIGDALNADSELMKQTHINAVSYNLIVLLTGEAPTEALRERAGELAGNVDRVRKVYNEIAIAAPSAMSLRSSDSWITTKVKTALLDVEGLEVFDSTRVKVVTERGVVYLLGLLTPTEAELVTETVRRVGGVQRVVRLFEYIEPPPAKAPATESAE